jgi:hypothetical protein
MTIICSGQVTYMDGGVCGQIDIGGSWNDFGSCDTNHRTSPGKVYATGTGGCNGKDTYRDRANGHVKFAGIPQLTYPQIPRFTVRTG